MKTAIQELIDVVEMDFNNGVEISMKVFYGMLMKAREKEKEQIIDAFNQGYREGFNDAQSVTENEKDVSKYDDAKNYYDRTFKNKEYNPIEQKPLSKFWQIKRRANYNLLLSSGMFFEFHPELSGEWEKDRAIIWK
jgi:hypothetical protein